MPSSKMSFLEAVDYAASLRRSGMVMGLAVAQTAEKTGHSARELAQALAERSHTVRRARQEREGRLPRFPRECTREEYIRATEGW